MAVGLNHGDIYSINVRRPSYPHAPGVDVAGVVDSVGTDVVGFEIGDRVRLPLLSAHIGPLTTVEIVRGHGALQCCNLCKCVRVCSCRCTTTET